MPSYLVESYAPVSGVEFLPGDETILHVFDAPSAEALHEAARDASLPHERIVEALDNGGQREEREKKP